MSNTISPIINCDALLALDKDLAAVIVDVSAGKDAYQNYLQNHLEGALFVDLNSQLATISNNAAQGGRHPLPSAEKFADTLTQLGIEKHSHVILYDDKNGANAAARFWWMLKAFGHEKVQVLNGGIQAAKANGYPMRAGIESILKVSPYPVQTWNLPLVNMNEVNEKRLDENYLIIDVRDAYRFDGISEPIDLIAGHIPGALNVPFSENLDANGLFLNPEMLLKKYEVMFQNKEPKNIIVHCGSGVTACHTILAIAYAGLPIPSLYTGSWSEWSRNDMPMYTLQSEAN